MEQAQAQAQAQRDINNQHGKYGPPVDVYIEGLNPRGWVHMIKLFPNITEYCDWVSFDEGDWEYLYKEVPHMREFAVDHKDAYLMMREV